VSVRSFDPTAAVLATSYPPPPFAKVSAPLPPSKENCGSCPKEGIRVDNKAIRSNGKRLIIELCTSATSRMGMPTKYSEDCEVVRITVDDDLTTAVGLEKALSAVRNLKGSDILLWISIPCTGGSPWQRINCAFSERARLSVAQHIALYRVLLRQAAVVAREVRAHGG